MNTAVNDEGLRRTAAARAQEDAKARLAEVSANIKRRQQSWSATPWKLWLARGVLALLAVLVISAAFRGVYVREFSPEAIPFLLPGLTYMIVRLFPSCRPPSLLFPLFHSANQQNF